jgi:iron complex transport system substrate-binding protein
MSILRTKGTARRGRGAALVAAAGMALVLSACGTGADPESEAAGAADSTSFPVTIDSAYENVTLEKAPERIVVLGSTYLDILTSLDVQPIAVTSDAYSDEQDFLKTFPWLEGAYTGEYDSKFLTAEYKISPEAVSVHKPDLIVGHSAQIDEKIYEQLSQIAPTYVEDLTTYVKDGRGWADTAADLAALTGKTDEAKSLISDVEEEMAVARQTLPGLQGKTHLQIGYTPGGNLLVWANNLLLSGLGMPAADNVAQETQSKATLSLENLDQLQSDVLMIAASDEKARAELEADPRFAQLPASQNGAVVYIDNSMHYATALSYQAPLSIKWSLEHLLPELQDLDLNSDKG